MGKYISTKTYGPEEGFAVCYRQWRADRKSGKGKEELYSRDEVPGCCALHGYALGFHLEFESEDLDSRNWVVDFGSLRPLKEFLKETDEYLHCRGQINWLAFECMMEKICKLEMNLMNEKLEDY